MLKFIANTSMSSSSGSSAKSSIGYVEVQQPSRLRIDVSGDVEPLVFSFAQSIFLKMFGLIFAGVGLSLLVGVAGLIIGVIGVVKLAQGNRGVAG